jgi:hypothetical protein
VEDAEQGSTRSVGRRRSSEWHMGSSGGRRCCGRRCDSERRRCAARVGGGRRGRARRGQRRGGKRRGRGQGDTCMRVEKCGSSRGGAHGRTVAAACGPNCNFRKMRGPYCNASITFKPVLKWRWAQKQKCMVFQNVQLFFKVQLQKS